MTRSRQYDWMYGTCYEPRPLINRKPRWRVIARRILSAITFTLAIITVWWAWKRMSGG